MNMALASSGPKFEGRMNRWQNSTIMKFFIM
jgi:hypothetical protein